MDTQTKGEDGEHDPTQPCAKKEGENGSPIKNASHAHSFLVPHALLCPQSSLTLDVSYENNDFYLQVERVH